MSKLKVGQKLADNIVALPQMLVWLQISSLCLMATLSSLPPNAYGKSKGVGSERMWVKIIDGDSLNGEGTLENEPMYSDLNYIKR